MRFCRQLSNAAAIGGTGVAFAPEPRIAEGEDFIDDGRIGLAERLDGDIVFPDIEQFIVRVVLVGSGDALDPRIGPFSEKDRGAGAGVRRHASALLWSRSG